MASAKRTRGVLAPSCQSPFRKTRSGLGFSPWTRNIGEPIRTDFNLDARMKALVDSVGDAEPASPNSAEGFEDPDEPTLATPFASRVSDEETRTVLNALFAGFTPTVDLAGTDDSRCSGSAPEPQFSTTSASALPPSPSQHAPVLSISKKRYHSQKRFKEKRRARRSTQQAKDELLHPGCMSLKGSALRQLSKTIALLTDADFVDSLASEAEKAQARPALCADPIDTELSLAMGDVPVAASAYVARFIRQTQADRRKLTADEVKALPKFRYIAWNGQVSHVLLDNQQRVIGLLDGHPNDPSWPRVNADLASIIRIMGSAYRLPNKRKPNRRGDFDTISCGISYGGGQKRVGNLALSTYNEALWRAALKLKAMRRVVNFANTSMKIFFPKIHQHYEQTLSRICKHDPTLKRNYDDVAFAAMSLNLGPQAISYIHTDHLNLAYGLCAITAIGDYNPKEGGHLILWDLGLIIEFPPGSTIIIPSALLRHSNAALTDENERRYALLQYSAGGLFRWADCGFQSHKAFVASGGIMAKSGRERWEEGVAMFSTWPELQRQGLEARLK